MPLYEFECENCGNCFEQLRSFQDSANPACPVCGGASRKVFSPAGIIFRGAGWYINDSRKPDTATDSGNSSDTPSKPPAAESKKE